MYVCVCYKDNSLRGVIALKKIPKGDIIIKIPYEAALKLGIENNDPTLPCSILLQEYCQWILGTDLSKMKKRDLGPYLQVLPHFGSDELGSTDFSVRKLLICYSHPKLRKRLWPDELNPWLDLNAM